MSDAVSVYAINLECREDRKMSIISEFENRSEFNLMVVRAITHQTGAVGPEYTGGLAAPRQVAICEGSGCGLRAVTLRRAALKYLADSTRMAMPRAAVMEPSGSRYGYLWPFAPFPETYLQ